MDKGKFKKIKLKDFATSTLKFNADGLIPAIAQDYKDNTVLMMAWMNEESIKKSFELGQAVYYSRSRQELWHKGAISGHFQNIKEFYYDCDNDTILIKVEQLGDVACHTGTRSCFNTQIEI